jgi:hypothetical protein
VACAVKRRRFPVGASPTRQPLLEIRSHIHLGSHELLLSVHSLPLEDGASRHQARFKIAP